MGGYWTAIPVQKEGAFEERANGERGHGSLEKDGFGCPGIGNGRAIVKDHQTGN